MSYQVVPEGEWSAAGVGDAEQVLLRAGEVVVFTKGDAHVMSSAAGMRAQPVTQQEIEAATAGPLPFFRDVFNEGGGDRPPSVKLVCGFLACDARPFNPLFDNLPPVIKSGRVEGDDSSWLGDFIRVPMAESSAQRAGGASLPAKPPQLTFIAVLLPHTPAPPPPPSAHLA